MFRKTLNQLPRLRGISLQHRSWQFGEELAGLGEPLTVAFHTEIVGPADRRLEVGQCLGEVGVGDNLAAGFHHLKAGRSEEHTSELQSRENLVCRLLLEKKKKTNAP